MKVPASRLSVVALAALLSLGAVACSGSGGEAEGSGGPSPSGQGADTTKSGDSGTKNDTGDSDGSAKSGSGNNASARITIAGETWDFDQMNCGFGEEGTGVEGAVFNLSATKDRLSLYAASEPDSSYIELADLDTMDDGGLNWTTQGIGLPEVAFKISGQDISATASFVTSDGNGSYSDPVEGTFEASC